MKRLCVKRPKVSPSAHLLNFSVNGALHCIRYAATRGDIGVLDGAGVGVDGNLGYRLGHSVWRAVRQSTLRSPNHRSFSGISLFILLSVHVKKTNFEFLVLLLKSCLTAAGKFPPVTFYRRLIYADALLCLKPTERFSSLIKISAFLVCKRAVVIRRYIKLFMLTVEGASILLLVGR